MAKRRIEIDITANDNASRIFNSIRSNASSMSSSLMSSLNGMATGFGNFERGLRSYNNSMYRFNRVVGRVMREAAESVYSFTKDAIENFTELERQHAKTMGAMATEYDKTAQAQAKFLEDSKRLKQQALNLGTVGPTGKGSLYTADEVAYAQTALVKSGMSANDLLNSGAVESILKFAGGNDLDIDTATRFAVNLGTVFNKPVEEWGSMLDMVTKAADISVIDVEDIMESLTYTGGIASGLGRDIEEVLGVIAVMGQAGLRGRVAGTGLQAFFTRILSAGELSDTQVDKAPTKYVGKMYNAFVNEATNPDGSFKDMDEVAELLDTAMSELNDKEQAWFAKKLFGLYQMKAAYALTGSVDDNENIITDFIDQIENQSAGTNDTKLELMLESQYGKLERTKSMWEGVKTDFGSRLSPIVTSVADELFNFLNDPTNYDINWDTLRTSISESGELIGEKYGEKLREIVEDIGNLGIDAAQIGEALAPQAGGFVTGIIKLLNGDISGALEDFSSGIEDTNKNIEGLPEGLQDTANAASNAFTALTALAGVNLVTQVAQPIVTAIYTLLGRPIQALNAKINGTNITASSTNSTINVGTATTVNISKVPLMNVTATVVNVYGGGLNNPGGGNGTPSLPSSGTPLLPGGSGGLLPGIAIGTAGTAAIGMGTKMIGGGSQLLLPGGAAAAGATGKAINMYKIGGTYMSAGDIVAKISGAAGKGLTLAAILGFANMSASPGLFKSASKRAQEGSDWIDKYVSEGNTDYNTITGNARVYDWTKEHKDYNGSNSAEIVEAEMKGRTAARDEMMAYYQSGEGAALLDDLFRTQIEENGKITEDFLAAITTWTKDGYTYTGTNEDIKSILEFMYSNFGTDYKETMYYGRFNDSAVNKFINGDPTLNLIGDMSQTSANMVTNTQLVNDATGNLLTAQGYLSDMINRVQQPVIKVNVTTNVDKSGNATTKVDMNSLADDVARRSAQYGVGGALN